MADGDSNREYEMVDPRCFVNTKHADLGQLPFLPPDVRDQKTKKIMAYENPVAMKSENEHTYESPVSTKVSERKARGNAEPKMRARVNDVYEGYNTDESMTNAKIFEAIRNLGSEKSSEPTKESCHIVIGGFAFFSLILLLLLSLGSSAYIFYRVEMQDSSRCSCMLYEDSNSAFSGVTTKNETDKIAIALVSKLTKQIKDDMKYLEKNFSEAWIDGTRENERSMLQYWLFGTERINKSLNSSNYRAKELKKIKVKFYNKTFELDKKITSMRITSNKANSNLSRQFERKLDEINYTIKSEIENLRKQLAVKASFRNCTLEIKKNGNIFTTADIGWVSLSQKSEEFKIVGVTCASTMNNEIQYSYLETNKEKAEYKCTCIRRLKKTSPSTDECVMYYWRCPNI